MDLPIRRLPPVVGPRPAPTIPKLGNRERDPGGAFAEGDGSGEAGPEREDPNENEEEEGLGPPPPGEAGTTLDLTA